MTQKRKDAICTLLKGIETGDPASVAVVNEAKYIQHNPQTHEGSEGLAALFKRLAQTNPRVNIVRIFSDGDYVFGHTEYDFATRRIGFEVFRFEGDQAVEHWDNIQPRLGPNPSGRSMVDGPTDVADLELTEDNRATARAFVEEVLINRNLEKLDAFIEDAPFIEHNPAMGDGVVNPVNRREKGININPTHRKIISFFYSYQNDPFPILWVSVVCGILSPNADLILQLKKGGNEFLEFLFARTLQYAFDLFAKETWNILE